MEAKLVPAPRPIGKDLQRSRRPLTSAAKVSPGHRHDVVWSNAPLCILGSMDLQFPATNRFRKRFELVLHPPGMRWRYSIQALVIATLLVVVSL